MLDKTCGTVAYAVIKTGGLLGSHQHCPISGTRSGSTPRGRRIKPT
jgi:hypothetical protein